MAFFLMCEMLGFEIETYNPAPLFRDSLMIRIEKSLGFFFLAPCHYIS